MGLCFLTLAASRQAALGKTSLDEWSVRRRDLNLATHNTQKTQKPTPPRDSKSQTQQSSSSRTTLWSAGPLG